jgi:hypothetical protein
MRDVQVGQAIRVWPRPGLLVVEQPDIPGRFLSPEGAEVVWSAWWQRRLDDGSVFLFDPRAPRDGGEG